MYYIYIVCDHLDPAEEVVGGGGHRWKSRPDCDIRSGPLIFGSAHLAID